MNTSKTVFIIPGFRQKPTNKAYKTLARILRKEGYSPVVIDIPWNKSTLAENADYFLQKYRKVEAKNKYIFGFSFGAIIALLASTKVRSSGLILCSLSPYFKEDLLRLGLTKNSKRYQDFVKLRCASLAKEIKAKQILMLYGEKEAKPLIGRVQFAFSQIISTHKYLIPIQKTEHNIADKRYLDTIHLAAKAFL